VVLYNSKKGGHDCVGTSADDDDTREREGGEGRMAQVDSIIWPIGIVTSQKVETLHARIIVLKRSYEEKKIGFHSFQDYIKIY
jgi:hypothetical protein